MKDDLVKELRSMPFDKTSVAGNAFIEAAGRIERLEKALRAVRDWDGKAWGLLRRSVVAALQDDKP